MLKKVVVGLLVVALAWQVVPVGSVAAQGGGIFYESRPDEVALYLSDIAFVRDYVTLPSDQEASILLPPGTFIDTLILKEDGARVRNYRVTPVTESAAVSTLYTDPALSYLPMMPSETAYVLTWTPEDNGATTRAVTLEYLLPGAQWEPTYDMEILDDSPENARVSLAFFAEITNRTLVLDEATVYLVAGRVALQQQVDQVPQVTMNQFAVGYSEDTVELPGLAVGSVDLQHVYRIGAISAAPGDTVYAEVVESELGARRLVAWNASTDQETDVIYKVRNTTETLLAEGIVRAYQDGLFMGSDFVEMTPVGGEGSITIGSLPEMRVHRTASRDYIPTGNDYYQHEVTLEISSFAEDALDVIVLDRWSGEGFDFSYSQDPIRQPDNLLRWEIALEPGESLTITYRYRTDA